MQSLQELSTTTPSCSHEESDGQGSIAPQSVSRKRKHSEMSSDSDEELGPNYDILKCFPPLLCRYVFSHFNAKQMLEMSTVNQEWNKFVGERPQVGKLWLNLDKYGQKLSSTDKIILLNSERKYQNIRFELSGEASQFALEMLAQRAGSWKGVKIERCNLIHEDLLRKVLEIVEPTVEELLLERVKLAESFIAETSWTYPCLKSLECFDAPFKPFVHVVNLVKIYYYPGWLGTSSATDLQTILRNNHNLKEMTIDEATFVKFPNEVKFKLQKFLILQEVDEDRSAVPENLFVFLTTHAKTLESLEIRGMELDHELLELILNMPKLKSLEIDFIYPDDEVPNFPTNPTIETFKMTRYNRIAAGETTPEERLAYQNFIRAMPNLKHFKCFRLDSELIFCLMDFPALESIGADFFDMFRIPNCDVFPNLKHFESSEYPLYIGEHSTADHNFAKLVKKDMRLKFNYLPYFLSE